MIHELRFYDVLPGQWEAWEEIFARMIMPLHVRLGINVPAAWRDEEHSQFVWVRTFENEEHRRKASEAVRNDPEFAAARPRIMTMIKVAEVRALNPTDFSPLQ